MAVLASVSWVSALKIRRGLRRHRRDLALLAAIVTLSSLIAVHHSGGLLEMDHDGGIGAIAEMCLGVFTAVGVVLAAGAAVAVLKRERALHATGAGAVMRVPVARARDGPAVVCILCVSRR